MKNRKIIFTDFFETLATRELKRHPNLAKQEYELLQTFLYQYLTNQNLMFIISSSDHLILEDFVMIFNKLTSRLDDEKRKKLFFYMIGSSKEGLKLPKNFYIIEGKKENVVSNLISRIKIKPEDTVIAAGNDANDINMLFKVHDIGGTSYFVNQYASIAQDMDIKDLIGSISSKEIALTKGILNQDESDKYYENNFDKYVKIYNNLHKLYETGNISREKLTEIYSILSINEEYDFFHLKEKRNLQKDKEGIEKKLVLVNDRKDIYSKFLN